MDKLKSVLSGEEARREDRTVLETVNEASSLSWSTRLRGFIVCFIIGVGCSILFLAPVAMRKSSGAGAKVAPQGVGCLFLPKIGITLFIVFYTFGNICTLGSTMFLMGPMKQVKRMCDKTRALATTIMITCLVLTLCAAFWWKNFGLALLFVILQMLSFAWYGLSYIPCVREALLKLASVFIR